MIPTSFHLAGLKINVITDNTMVANKHVIGEARYASQQILIDKEAASEDLTEQSFLHETIHWILYMMNETELQNNEKFVDCFAHYWYQFNKTSKFE